MNATAADTIALRAALGRDMLVTADEAAVHLRCSVDKVRAKIDAHRLRAIRAGSARLWHLSDVADLFREGREEPPPSPVVEPRGSVRERPFKSRR